MKRIATFGTQSFLLFVSLFGAFTLNAQYTLTVEATPAITAGSTTYRFYVDMQDPTDRMSAVFGNDQASLLVNTPAGAFNSPFNSSWNASGINPAFLPVFPELADDSYATIGLTGPASTSGIAGAADPSLVEDATQPITPYFLTPGDQLGEHDAHRSFMVRLEHGRQWPSRPLGSCACDASDHRRCDFRPNQLPSLPTRCWR